MHGLPPILSQSDESAICHSEGDVYFSALEHGWPWSWTRDPNHANQLADTICRKLPADLDLEWSAVSQDPGEAFADLLHAAVDAPKPMNRL